MPNTDVAVLSRISSLIAELDGDVKTASANTNGHTKKSETELGLSGSSKKDPGGYTGGSTHPSAKVDSGLQKTPLGPRAKENEKDVKEDHPGAGVDNTNAGGGGSQDDRQIESGGMKQRATGEDHEHERDFKGTKEDPGTTHPADAESIGEKYSSMRFEPLCKLAYDRMNEIVADIANGQSINQPASQDQQIQAAEKAGYDLAGAAGNDPDMEKVALAHMMTSQVIKDAQIDADLVGEYLYKYAAHREALRKQAEGDPTGMDAMGGGAPPMDPAAMGGGAPPMDPAAMGGGGAPPMDPAAAGGDPAAAGGDPTGGGGGGQEDAVNELANAIVEMGISPEEIVAAMENIQGGGGGGDPAAATAGGPAGPGGPAAPGGMGDEKSGSAKPRVAPEDVQAMYKLAAAVHQHQRSGKMRLKEAREGSRTRHERDEIKGYIREVCGIR